MSDTDWEGFIDHEGFIDGVRFRVAVGKKKPRPSSGTDLRLDWYVNGEWRPVTMDVAFMMCDFFWSNEQRLYNAPSDRGGEKFTDAVVKVSMRGDGWRAAKAQKDAERAAKDDATIYPLFPEAC